MLSVSYLVFWSVVTDSCGELDPSVEFGCPDGSRMELIGSPTTVADDGYPPVCSRVGRSKGRCTEEQPLSADVGGFMIGTGIVFSCHGETKEALLAWATIPDQNDICENTANYYSAFHEVGIALVRDEMTTMDYDCSLGSTMTLSDGREACADLTSSPFRGDLRGLKVQQNLPIDDSFITEATDLDLSRDDGNSNDNADEEDVEDVEEGMSTLPMCAGHPSQCCGHVKSSCELIDGCEWIGDTPGNTLYGKCQGSSSPCEMFSDDKLACRKQGCTFGPNPEAASGSLCTGTPIPEPVCTGTPLACTGGSKYTCEKTHGCEAVGQFPFISCKGPPTPCSYFTDGNDDECGCKNQGCTYYEDPPNDDESFYDAIMPLREDFQCLSRHYYVLDYYGEVKNYKDVVVCEKCRPSTDGAVCYTELLSYLDSPQLFLGNVMKIGERFCAVEFCGDAGDVAFNCAEVLDTSGGNRVVVGRDCDGRCIWSGEPTPTHLGAADPTTPTLRARAAPPTTTQARLSSLLESSVETMNLLTTDASSAAGTSKVVCAVVFGTGIVTLAFVLRF